MLAQQHAGTVLTIDLGAICANYRLLRSRCSSAQCAAVVKANAYGLGIEQVAPALSAEGCRTFFVATIDEGLALRAVLERAHGGENPRNSPNQTTVFVLSGVMTGAEETMLHHRLTPVLNGLNEVDAWAAMAKGKGTEITAALHVDTGMSRLGLPDDELDELSRDWSRLQGIHLAYVMSHLACADEPGHEMNRAQLEAFRLARQRLPSAPASFANSAGIFLGSDYHMVLTRPGISLYGGSPSLENANPMAQVIKLQGKVLQVREIDRGRSVGYGATYRADRRTRVATVAVGYADGYLRSLSHSGGGYIGDVRVPLVGRVSMDLVTFDVSDLPETEVRPGSMIELIGAHNPIDVVAAEAGTISYEILTGLGSRYHRTYVSATGPA